jgi:iron complex outermembrane receptor protein
MHTPHRLSPLTVAVTLALAASAATSALAQAAAPAPAASASAPAPDADVQRVVITQGRGQVRSVQAVTKTEFEEAPAGSSPLVTVARLPGVNFQSADPLGNYEWSTRFTVRAFSQNQLGFTLDDIPLGDMSYGNFNGLHISRAISSENVARAYLSQGSGSLETASSSNLGGTLQFYSSDPRKTFGVEAQQSFGSSNEWRTFARVDSGETGFGRVFLSVDKQDADKWKGEGQQRQQQVNLKYVGDFGPHRLSLFVDSSKRREIDYQDMSLEMINRLGRNWDNFYPDFQKAVDASNAYCGNNGSQYVTQCDDAYYAGSGLRDDTLAAVAFDAKLAEGLRLKTTVYHHTDDGRGLWYTPYVASPDGTPVSLRTTEYAIDRTGEIVAASWLLGDHDLRLGLWHEGNDFDQARRFYATPASAVPSPYQFPSDPFFTQWQYKFKTTTNQFWLSDAFAVTPDLTVSGGFKSLDVTADSTLEVGSDRPSGRITAHKGFLPQFGVNYKLSDTDEVFASAARNMRAYQVAGTGLSPFATTVAGFDAIKSTLKPETADSLEAGWRTASKLYEGTLTMYAVNFHDRLLGVAAGSGIQGNPTILANVGGVRTYGLEASLSLRLMPGVTWYNSLSESHSTYQDDVVSDGVTVATKGKHVVDAPDTMLKSILGYDDGALFGHFGMDYMSKRFYSYTNDASVGGRTVFNLGAGYRVKNLGLLKEGTVQVAVTNLLDAKYVSTIGSNGFVNSDPTGTAQTLLVAPPRQFVVTFGGKF